MEDCNQIEVPPSFTALFTAPGGHRLTEPMSFVRERYELCEDLAQALTEQAAAVQFRTGEPEAVVLRKMESTLSAEGSALQPPEAQWVVRRLAELLGWSAGSLA
jgi:hypothetical protein